jgi:hypothetical protein
MSSLVHGNPAWREGAYCTYTRPRAGINVQFSKGGHTILLCIRDDILVENKVSAALTTGPHEL